MAKKKIQKTNAVRLLEQKKIPFELKEYEVEDGQIDGTSVAKKTGEAFEHVYKTLVAMHERERFVFLIPVDQTLDLKKAAQAVGVKKIEMLPLSELTKETGYVRGGCSAVGMKKLFPTYIEERAKEQETIVVSAGKVGLQMVVSPLDLADVTEAKFASLIVEEESNT